MPPGAADCCCQAGKSDDGVVAKLCIHSPAQCSIGNANAEDTAKDMSHDNAMCASSRYCLCIAMVTGTPMLSWLLQADSMKEVGKKLCSTATRLKWQRALRAALQQKARTCLRKVLTWLLLPCVTHALLCWCPWVCMQPWGCGHRWSHVWSQEFVCGPL